MASHLIPDAAVSAYAKAPSSTKVASVVSLHTTIRDVLGSEYETFLQGSYKNGTGVADLNDVDIVAIRKETYSTVFSERRFPNNVYWETIFYEIQQKLEASHHYRGKTKPGDKCIKVNTGINADVVPAVLIGDVTSDPIAVYSMRERKERQNYPRVHAKNNTTKHQATGGTYKPTVRMFKRWVRNVFDDPKEAAPSFYVECLVHSVPNAYFDDDLAQSFFNVAHYITGKVIRSTVVDSVAGDKDILVPEEWHPDRFDEFQELLNMAKLSVGRALTATSSTAASKHWRFAFGE